MDYTERLSVPLRWWVQGTMLVATFWLAILAAVPEQEYIAWGATALALALMAAVFLSYGSARVGVDDGEVVAGRARIPLGLIGQVTALDADSMRRQAGVDADARAHLVLRPYLKRGVRIDIDDPADSVPYWLVSCRHPDKIVAAMTSRQVS